MGQKADPRGVRIGINKSWSSRWYNQKNYQKLLRQDIELSEYIKKNYRNAGISAVEIERSVAKIRIIIFTNRPGILIGRGGKGLEELKTKLERKFFFEDKLKVQIDVNEVKTIEENAQLLADDAASQLERRMPFRRTMKTMLDKVMQNRNVQGVKVQLSGRLGGAEMSRKEWLSKGNIPLQTLRANIDYAQSTAFTPNGTLGVKVWLHKVKSNENHSEGNNFDRRNRRNRS
jgi:small subunit ribosomal protein S3